MDFEGIEFNPLAAGVGLLGGVLSLVVSKSSPAGVFTKLLTFAVSTVVCYFVWNFIMNK